MLRRPAKPWQDLTSRDHKSRCAHSPVATFPIKRPPPTRPRRGNSAEFSFQTKGMGFVGRFLLCLLIMPAGPGAAAPLQKFAPVSVLGAEETGLIINVMDPLSVVVGEYYAARRHLPPGNILRVKFLSGWSGLAPDEFEALKAHVDALLPRRVQVLALAWTAPYRVGCMSMTTAFAFGYDPSFCGNHCSLTRRSVYFDSPSRLPFEELGIRPAMMLAARDFEHARALIDRGAASMGRRPSGSAYLLATSDRTRSVRQALFPAALAVARGRINAYALRQEMLLDRSDVLFYFTGAQRVAGLETLGFIPGAIADHLTSFGGQLTDSPQMSILRWLEAGATGSYGTVVEPCNHLQKFPNPAIVMARYLQGETLVEAYWKSVAMPGEGVFVGDPLAAPFALPEPTAVSRATRLKTAGKR